MFTDDAAGVRDVSLFSQQTDKQHFLLFTHSCFIHKLETAAVQTKTDIYILSAMISLHNMIISNNEDNFDELLMMTMMTMMTILLLTRRPGKSQRLDKNLSKQ